MDETGGVECSWTDPSGHPQCPHGPTLLFSKCGSNNPEQFYACSACRHRKLCKFYLKHGDELPQYEKLKWEKERKNMLASFPHQKLFIRFNEIYGQQPVNRCYCHTCERFIFGAEKEKHSDHEKIENLPDYQMTHPTELMKPLDNAKKEAQFLFSKKSAQDISQMLMSLGAKQVLCIGAPRIHEYIQENCNTTISSLLLDIDGRFHNFFGPLNFCWYNLFNHHFFKPSAIDVFKDFMTQNNGKDTYLICDPPFGGRVEPMSWTIKKISDLHKKWNHISDENDCLKIMFIFPHYMEAIMKRKSTPSHVSGGLKDLQMSDYKVDYDNHPLFITNTKSNKLPSPVRIFTNIPLNLLELPVKDGYKHCKRCNKWVSMENRHCKKCKACTSRDGRRYRHCNKCERCVKPTWKHCIKCQRCRLEQHNCSTKPRVIGKCFKCNEIGHAERDCTLDKENGVADNGNEVKKNRKRKKPMDRSVVKKSRDISEESEEAKAKIKKRKLDESKPKTKKAKLDEAKPKIKKAKLGEGKPKIKKTKLNAAKPKVKKTKLVEAESKMKKIKAVKKTAIKDKVNIKRKKQKIKKC